MVYLQKYLSLRILLSFRHIQLHLKKVKLLAPFVDDTSMILKSDEVFGVVFYWFLNGLTYTFESGEVNSSINWPNFFCNL